MATDTRSDVLARIDAEHEAWRQLVAEVGEGRMQEPGPMGAWTFKDLAAHLVGWRQYAISRLRAVAAGESEPAPPWPDWMEDDDTINGWIQERSDGRSTREVLDEADRSYDDLASALGALPPEVLSDPAGIPWLGGEAATDVDWLSHLHEEHLPSIREWLATRG